jgi:hypothetical protein
MANYYVSRQNGNDGNAGTSPATAKATIGAGLGLMSAGDTLYIGPGIYRETFTDTDFTAGTSGNETKIIGDPECQYLTTDTPGIVRVTGCGTDEIPTSGVVWDSLPVAYLWIKNLNIDGSSNNYAVQTSSTTQYWENCVIQGYQAVFASSNDSPIFKNCLFIGGGGPYCSRNTSTINCVAIAPGGSLGLFYTGYHIGSISIGGAFGFQECYDESFEDSFAGSRGSCYNCLSVGASTAGFFNCTGYNNMALGARLDGFNFSNANQMIGAFSLNCGRGSRATDGSLTYMGPTDSLLYSVYYATLNSAPVNSGTVNNAPHVGFSINTLRHIQKAFEPLNTMPSGTADTNYAAWGLKAQTVTRSYLPTDYEGTSGTAGSYPTLNWGIPTEDVIGKPINPSQWINPGPYYINSSQSIDVSNTSGSEFSIRIDGYGGMNFDLPVSASQPFTASVAVKYNVSSVPPIMMISSSLYSAIEVEFTPLSAQATGTGDQTGAWQTLTITGSSTANNILNLKLLQGDGNPTGSSFAIFSNLQVNE